MLPATCLPDHCFCERVLHGPIAQLSDSWSAIAFFIVGILVLLLALQKPFKANPLTLRRGYSIAFALILFFLGAGTFYYHAKLTALGQYIDGVGMYLVATSILFYRYGDTHRKAHHLIFWFVFTDAVLGFILYKYHIGRTILAAVIAAVLILEFELRRVHHLKLNKKYLFWSLTSLTVGFILWTLDLKKIICQPDSLVQGHAIWHALTASASFLMFLYYRSETRILRKR